MRSARHFQAPFSWRHFNSSHIRPTRRPIQQQQQATGFNATKKFLRINTSLTEVDFGPGKRMSLRLLSPSSDLMNFTERDVLESPLRSNLPFWAFLWPGGYAVTRWILEGSCPLEGGVVVDIGSGCASASIAAKVQGAAVVIANDTDPFACWAAADNSRCNGAASIAPCSLDLLPLLPTPSDAAAAVAALERRISLFAPHVSHRALKLLLLGDMLYDGDTGPRVLALAEAACASGWLVVTGDPGRSIAVSQGRRLGTHVACYDLTAELRACNYGMASTSVYVAGGE
jgi:predicted nicotinamide N-methyase